MAEAPTPSPNRSGTSANRPEDSQIWWATTIGVILAFVGVVDGLVMATRRKVATCPNGHWFPPGTTNFTCYQHPHAGDGIAIAIFSVLLGILVVFAAIATTTLRARDTGRREE